LSRSACLRKRFGLTAVGRKTAAALEHGGSNNKVPSGDIARTGDGVCLELLISEHGGKDNRLSSAFNLLILACDPKLLLKVLPSINDKSIILLVIAIIFPN
jgi:hypothetical protein